ncbi:MULTISPECIES: PEPxxWA-CTERM sorting domain-containing protein [unclassified Phenylobacterium]|uniref:PEPxxWA-CTERM sorting domain-containing protein n=1 Tax=unclassified Phenylobacterium TaxID=2640670 RepID=UPI00083A72C0|nr:MULTISPECIES: PEPxxWA-CTERM sorting domain-containing protein [unclassified Phenylobacterium]
MTKFNQAAFAVAAAAGMLAASGSASAAQYISKLEYSQDGYSSSPFGTVTLTEGGSGNGAYVDVLVQLLPPLTNLVDTGAHYMFAFNLADTTNSTVTLLDPALDINAAGNADGYTFYQNGDRDQAPFMNFSEAIAYNYPGQGNGNNSAAPTLAFRVSNANGITFVGPGNQFTSTTVAGGNIAGFTKGWWFAADVKSSLTSGPNSNTFTVAARDFCTVGVDCNTGVVPEPGTWALMILGFGAAGGMLRRRRHVAVVA